MLGSKERREKIKQRIKEILEHGINNMNLAIKESHNEKDSFMFIKELEIEDNYIIVRLQGAVDSSTIPAIEERNKGHEDKFDRHIIIDFKDVKHIDCSTLAILVTLFSALKEHNKELIIINATEQLVAYIDILKLKSVIKVISSEKKAIEKVDCNW